MRLRILTYFPKITEPEVGPKLGLSDSKTHASYSPLYGLQELENNDPKLNVGVVVVFLMLSHRLRATVA